MLTDLARVVLNIAWTADILATIVAVVFGSFWYHPKVFGTLWAQLINCKQDINERKIHMGDVAMWTIPIFFIIAANIAAFCKYFEFDTPEKSFLIGYDFGLVVCLFMAINYLRERRPLALFGINAGFTLIATSLMGIVIGMVL